METMDIIFSCATYGRRAAYIHEVVEILLSNPTFPHGSRVIINVPEKDYHLIQLSQLDSNVDVFIVPEDLGSFNKFYYTAKEFSSCTIAIFDDDINYSKVDFTQFLKHIGSGCVVAGHIHPLTGYRYNYEINYEESEDIYFNVVPVGAYLVFYPPYSLEKALHHAAYIAKLTRQDDIYLRYCTKYLPVMMPTRTWNTEHGARSIKKIELVERGISYKRKNTNEITGLLQDKLIFSDVIENNEQAEDIDYVVPYAGLNYREVARFYEDHDIPFDFEELHKRFNYGEGIFRLLVRGVAKNLPFIKNLIILVSHMTHIPEWLDTDKVRLVYVEDLIDGKLPYNFNSNTIESLLAEIPDLSPRFLYSPDDVIATKPLTVDDFYCGNYTRISLFEGFGKGKALSVYIANAYNMLVDKFGAVIKPFFPEYHSITPLVTKRVKEIYNLLKEELHQRLTPLRENSNVQQCLYPMYDVFNGYVIPKSYKHGVTNNGLWKHKFNNCDIICLNNIDDSCPTVDKVKSMYGLDEKCKYEK